MLVILFVVFSPNEKIERDLLVIVIAAFSSVTNQLAFIQKMLLEKEEKEASHDNP
jgi:hypothetical protein